MAFVQEKIKAKACPIFFYDFMLTGTHWIALHVNSNDVTKF